METLCPGYDSFLSEENNSGRNPPLATKKQRHKGGPVNETAEVLLPLLPLSETRRETSILKVCSNALLSHFFSPRIIGGKDLYFKDFHFVLKTKDTFIK